MVWQPWLREPNYITQKKNDGILLTETGTFLGLKKTYFIYSKVGCVLIYLFYNYKELLEQWLYWKLVEQRRIKGGGNRDSEKPSKRYQVTDCISLLIDKVLWNWNMKHMIQFVVYKWRHQTCNKPWPWICYLITAYSNFACKTARKDESYQIPESVPVEEKGIVLGPCEGNLTVRSSFFFLRLLNGQLSA